ncbi:ribosomal RNA small subunit methyltransferase A [Bacteriovorax stolpii]|uniref:Ribosomal RNA small subunit methyltransferase A n=1 Tax=Bacteriovorax stolpii TaxID=960 RepID=A0A2K9NP40_BACTC|nr:16S rRNA (adenine(1518)-N(6)/adenine(1519)-N(6))-dimethyltransferase RsmA [Bacteriovorax stolpii]AUN97286.1 ribosomal RNA small subunit methyltransferase A [Bacteriovorax stolpii]QDK42776.1 ribosomal RNA small subunit methyltransferase A [Bacteriovorax stolpii]TDP52457.1 16S rRNA (adenine1518-N6/adenine1519-N6)-dimethyltransferase [Bacteriovorax stolpii]
MKMELPLANKSLGQHFLRDSGVIDRICSDFKGQAEAVLEIGPGPGILTEFLALRSKSEGLPFFVIEKDDRFPPYLLQFINDNQITMTDALAVHLSAFFKEKNIDQKNIWLVSNLPYNISTPLLINFLQAPEIKYMTLMFQKEVADKVFPFSTTKNYMGSLLAITQTYFDCKLLCKVPPGAFNPPPKVDSAVLTMSRRETPLVPLSEFHALEKFLRLLFSQKRKQLGGILKASFPLPIIESSFNTLGIPLTIRAEALELNQVIELYRMLKK